MSKSSLKRRFLSVIALSLAMVLLFSTGFGALAQQAVDKIVKSNWKLFLNGEPQLTSASGYNINGNNYYKLRDIAQMLDIGVSYDGKTREAYLDTKSGYRVPDAPLPEARKLKTLNWAPDTYKALNALIEKNGILSNTYAKNHRPYVVFDFDNTTVINDVAEALLIYQLENLRFKIAPDKMADVIMTAVPKDNFLVDYKNKAGANINIEKLSADIAKSYAYLYDNYKPLGGKGSMTIEEVRKTPQYMDFITKVRFAYDAINGTFDASVGYPWVTYLFTGMTGQEVQKLAEESNDYWIAYGNWEKVTWESPVSLPGQAGLVSVSYKTSVRFTEETKDLYNTLMENGIDVFVCSASFYDIILTSATNAKYGLNVKPENVYAMMLKKDKDGRYINEYDNEYFQTQGKGKTHTINAFIRGQYENRDPIMVAGDSSGDYNMMIDYDGMQLGLIINRYRSGSFGELSKQAANAMGKPDPRYVLQGRDENTGLFRPSEKTILLGETEEKLVR